MEQLPSVEALASCPEEKLLKLWEGLGYYSRVRNLQKAAKQILLEFDGEFPSEIDKLKSLAGVGSYTAGAIASIAFGKRRAAVDGNVFRVAARLTENSTVISDPKYRKELEETLSAVYPSEGEACSAFTQSLFELGALICKPQNPDCKNCPLSGLCKANKTGKQTQYPVLPAKREKRVEEVYVFLIQTPQGFCLRRREEGVLRGMNEFPSHVCTYGESANSVLSAWGISEYQERNRKQYKHIFTHIVWNITCCHIETEIAPFDCYTLDEIEESISLPTAFKQCLDIIKG
jgi:A/G-specific adenine glycosylase